MRIIRGDFGLLVFGVFLTFVSCSRYYDNPLELCGNGVRDPGETCDGECVTVCDDSDVCTVDELFGEPSLCRSECQFSPILQCKDTDGCCPMGCSSLIDDDCTNGNWDADADADSKADSETGTGP